MKRRAALWLWAVVVQAVPAAAQPCVGATYDQPFAGAVDVVMRYADVPSAQFPGVWQEGRIDGDFYQIFSNRVAVLRGDALVSGWSITVDCGQRPCRQTVTGTPPEAAKATGVRLEQCLVPPEVKVAAPKPDRPKPDQPKPDKPKPPAPQTSAIEAPDEPKPKPPVAAAAPVSAPPKLAKPATPAPGLVAKPATAPAAPKVGGQVVRGATVQTGTVGMANMTGAASQPAVNGSPAAQVVCTPVPPQDLGLRLLPCGLALVPPGTPEASLQRLLLLAGANPGRVDGSYGRKTKLAVQQVLGFAGRDLDLMQSIAAVDAYLCRPDQPCHRPPVGANPGEGGRCPVSIHNEIGR